MFDVQTSALATQVEQVGRAVLCAPPSAISATSPLQDCDIIPPAPDAPRLAPTDVNFDYFFENALTFKARQWPFNRTISVHFPPHAISHLTHYSLAICAICSDKSALPCKPKTRRVSRCPSMALNPIRTYSYQKNSEFFPGAFMGKHWQISEKHPKKPPQKGPKTRDFRRVFTAPICQSKSKRRPSQPPTHPTLNLWLQPALSFTAAHATLDAATMTVASTTEFLKCSTP